MHVLFVAPEFPKNQLRFVRALADVGARVTGIGEAPIEALPETLKQRLHGYERIGNCTDEQQLLDAVRRVQAREWVDRLEATVEAHVLSTARVREAATIPGLSAKTAYLCRDKPAMKDFLREAGVPCAASRGVHGVEEALAFAREVGFPIVVKPRAGAGASGTTIVKSEEELRSLLGPTAEVAVEELNDGHEGFYDTLTVKGEIRHDFVSHYYPNVLEAMRERWISPQIVVQNRVDQPHYDEVRALGRKVIDAMVFETAPTHMEWFFGTKGLRFSEIGARPPGVGHWDLYSAANDIDIYREWADAIVHGNVWGRLSRAYAAGIVALRPDRDGIIDHYEGVDSLQSRFGQHIVTAHLPPPGTPTQAIERGYMANAWVQVRHPDFDTLREILDTFGRELKVRAR